MNLLFLLMVIVSVSLFACSIVLLNMLFTRNTRIDELEKMLNQAGNDASSNKRSLESLKETHESERERLQQTESELSDLRKDLCSDT